MHIETTFVNFSRAYNKLKNFDSQRTNEKILLISFLKAPTSLTLEICGGEVKSGEIAIAKKKKKLSWFPINIVGFEVNASVDCWV